MQYRSNTKKVKRLGASKHGFQHWWMQRLSAVLMIPLGLWFFYSLTRFDNLAPDTLIMWLHQPVQALLMSLWVITVVYHAALGLQVIVEDYVSTKSTALTLLVLIKFAMLTSIVATLFALFKLAS